MVKGWVPGRVSGVCLPGGGLQGVWRAWGLTSQGGHRPQEAMCLGEVVSFGYHITGWPVDFFAAVIIMFLCIGLKLVRRGRNLAALRCWKCYAMISVRLRRLNRTQGSHVDQGRRTLAPLASYLLETVRRILVCCIFTVVILRDFAYFDVFVFFLALTLYNISVETFIGLFC